MMADRCMFIAHEIGVMQMDDWCNLPAEEWHTGSASCTSWPSRWSAICREISAQSRKGWRTGGARV